MYTRRYLTPECTKLLSESHLSVCDILLFVHEQLRSMVLDECFRESSIRTAFSENAYRISLYQEMGEFQSVSEICEDLESYLQYPQKVFVSCFSNPNVCDSQHFDLLLKDLLQKMIIHSKSSKNIPVLVSSGVCSFEFAQQQFIVVGFHTAHHYFAHRFAWPTLIFSVKEIYPCL